MKRTGTHSKHDEMQAALRECDHAVDEGRFTDAERWLSEATELGAMPHSITPRARAIRALRQARKGPGRRAVWAGFAVAVVGYMILSMQQPAGWGEIMWAGLAFLLVPALVGLVVRKVQGAAALPREAFLCGLKAAGWAMALYAAITLIVLARRIGRADAGGQEFLAGVIVTTVYSLIAGGAAGLVGLLLARGRAERTNHGPTS